MNPQELTEERGKYVESRNNPNIPVITATAIIKLDHLLAFTANAARLGADAVRVNLIRFSLDRDTTEILTANGVLSQVSFAFEPVKIVNERSWIVTSVANDRSILCVCPPTINDNDTGLCPPKCSGDEGI